MTLRTRRTILVAAAIGIAVMTIALALAPDAGGPPGTAHQRAGGAPGSPTFEVPATAPPPGQTISADVVVYGATPSGIVAAISAARLGASVVLATPEGQVGGMMTSGLGHADVGRADLIGGLTRDVFGQIARAEGREPDVPPVGWNYEPHVARAVFEDLLRKARVTVYLNLALDRTQPPQRDGDRIVALRMTNGTRIGGRVFIDATYEGDLMAAAGVPYAMGRESRAAYGESLAGEIVAHPRRPSSILVSGLDDAGNPLPGADAVTIVPGSADGLVQSATFRLCVTDDPSNRLPFAPPDGYDPAPYALVGRDIGTIRARTGAPPRLRSLLTLAQLPDRKADLNNFGLFSTDLVGGAAGWANADDATRSAVWQQHRDWVAGLLWYLETDSAVPASIRTEIARWGLCADEFTATGGWPPELYIREARRMIGSTVLTQGDIQEPLNRPDAIALGTYRIDAHYARRVIGPDGLVRGDGGLSAETEPYQIPYAAIVPPPASVDNLLVGVTISATHVAWASIRTEPTLMQIGEAAGVAAALAAGHGVGVREVSPAAIRIVLLARGGILVAPRPVPPSRIRPVMRFLP